MILNAVLTLIDTALDGITTLALTADHTLTATNGAADEARARVLKLTGTSAWTVTLNSRSKWYLIWNASSAIQTIACSGGGTSVTVLAGEVVPVLCDANNVKRLTLLTMNSQRLSNVLDPTSAQDAATKAYVDATAFSMTSGALPGQGGNSGKFLTTDSLTASWGYAVTAGAGLASVATNTLTVTAAAAADVRTGTTKAKAMTPGDTYDAYAEVTLTSTSNAVALDLSTGINFVHTLTENTTLAAPTNAKAGQKGRIRLVQHASAAKTFAYNAAYKRDGGSPTISTTLSAEDYVYFDVISSSKVIISYVKAPS